MNEWVASSGKACYVSLVEGYAISQSGILTIGKLYSVSVTISGMTKGKLVLDSLVGKPEFTEDGVYSVVGIAEIADLVFIGAKSIIDVFDGCIDDVGARLAPMYQIIDQIIDGNGNIVFTQVDETGITGSSDNIQYEIDWSGLAEGCYRIRFNDGISTYFESDCITLKESHDCTLKLTWTNNENAYGFDYTNLQFIQTLRVEGKKWQPKYPKEKEVFKDSVGNRMILRSDTTKTELLTVNEIPAYLHDALSIGVEHDVFKIDDVEYVNEESEYGPKWRKSSPLASVEVEVIKKDQDLTNENCA